MDITKACSSFAETRLQSNSAPLVGPTAPDPGPLTPTGGAFVCSWDQSCSQGCFRRTHTEAMTVHVRARQDLAGPGWTRQDPAGPWPLCGENGPEAVYQGLGWGPANMSQRRDKRLAALQDSGSV
uniref:Uncharacterized protein n=1 Tax=Knipowitschia caucasica TaxID=637954 RepID=A0AAV2M2C4_KNICA